MMQYMDRDEGRVLAQSITRRRRDFLDDNREFDDERQGRNPDFNNQILGQSQTLIKAHLLKDKQISSVGVFDEVFSTWRAFGGNTRDLSSFGEETDKATTLHQNLLKNDAYRP
ncbi:hypothetical protein Tco_0429095 [Tanacetum coccineum]